MSGPRAACPTCRGTGDVLRPGSALTYRMCLDCGGSGVDEHLPGGGIEEHRPGVGRWAEPGDGSVVVIDAGRDAAGVAIRYLFERDDARAALWRARNRLPRAAPAGAAGLRWFDCTSEDLSPSYWDSLTEVATAVYDAVPRPAGLAAVVPLRRPAPARAVDVGRLS